VQHATVIYLYTTSWVAVYASSLLRRVAAPTFLPFFNWKLNRKLNLCFRHHCANNSISFTCSHLVRAFAGFNVVIAPPSASRVIKAAAAVVEALNWRPTRLQWSGGMKARICVIMTA
jgi:hypothetical protein